MTAPAAPEGSVRPPRTPGGATGVASPKRPLRNLVRLLDTLTVLLAIALALAVHDLARQMSSAFKPSPGSGTLALFVAIVLPMWLGVSALLGLDRVFEAHGPRGGELVGLLKLHGLGFAGIAILLVLTQLVFNRSLVVAFVGSSFVLMSMSRLLLHRWQRFRHDTGHRPRLLVVGDPSAQLDRFLEGAASLELAPAIVGRLGAPADGGPHHLGDLGALPQILHEQAVDHVLFFPPYQAPGSVAPALTACETIGVPAEFALDLVRPAQAQPRLITLYEVPFISFDVAPKRQDLLALKHALDVILAVGLLVILAPVMLAVALLILATMGRPILFMQERGGIHGRTFRMLKFRTMARGAEQRKHELAGLNEMTGPVFKATHDPRITRLGRLLRVASLDELPQLLNVLGGSMSLVGPRPLATEEQQQIRGWHRRRLSMRPGISGLWQVSGRSDVDFEAWMRLDLEYVDHWSPWLDLAILVRTVPAVIFGRGAR